MRPLAAVIGLVLTGALLACSDPVPPPGATLSGEVWIDANANGLRDSCDPPRVSPVGPVFELRDSKGEPREAKATDGKFKFTDVPPGDYTLAMQQRDNTQWPVTAPRRDDGFPGYALSLGGLERIDDLDFAVAVRWPLAIDPGNYGLVAVFFQDVDRDGQLDAGECPLKDPWELRASTGNAEALMSERLFEFDDLESPPQNVKPVYEKGISWMYEGPPHIATRLDASGCAAPVMPVPVAGSRLSLAAVAMRPPDGRSIVAIRPFLDVEADGERDSGDPPLHLLITLAGPCPDGPNWPPLPVGSETLTFTSVPAGKWRVLTNPLELPWASHFQMTWTAPPDGALAISDGDNLTLDLGLTFPGAGLVRVLLVRDDNLNGVADPGEPALNNAGICYRLELRNETAGCSSSESPDGRIVVGPIEPGSYRLWATRSDSQSRPGEGGLSPEEFPITVAADEVASLTIPLPP